jgi:hypothetical protein
VTDKGRKMQFKRNRISNNKISEKGQSGGGILQEGKISFSEKDGRIWFLAELAS